MAITSNEIKKRAAEIGFNKSGIVAAERLTAESSHLDEWLGRGFHGEMSWMAREPQRRADPRKIFPQARSVVVLALNYYTPFDHADTAATGKISRYAWGDDYHDVMREKLDLLLDWITDAEPTAVGKICVDTAPIMDKAWAVRARIGWIGKHSNVISKEFGSWIFLGEILLNLELDYELGAEENHCGTCSACIDACPTQAIVEPYVVDSVKCISYSTIELRADVLPRHTSENLNGWLYGCDICQDVCPWNRFEKPTGDERFLPRGGETAPALETVADLTPERFAERFRRSAVKRTKLSGLRRNAKALIEGSHGRKESL